VQGPGQGSNCDPHEHHNIYEVDATTQELSWDYCAWTRERAVKRQGQLTLSTEQMLDVRSAVAALGPGRPDACGADAALVLLDVRSNAGTLTLQDDFYSCMPTAGRTPVSNIDPLARLIGSWVREASEPTLRKLTVVSSGGFVQAASADSECPYAEYPNTYSVTIAPRQLDWDLCQIDAASSVASLYRGSRTLDESELARLTSIYEKKIMIASPECVADEPRTTLDAETSETTFRYLSNGNACGPLLGDDPFVTGLGQLRFEFGELLPAR